MVPHCLPSSTPRSRAPAPDRAQARLPAAPLPIYPGDVASYGLIGSVKSVTERITAFEAAGVQELILQFADLPSAEQITHFAQTLSGSRHARDGGP
jgi:hypothetical protein